MNYVKLIGEVFFANNLVRKKTNEGQVLGIKNIVNYLKISYCVWCGLLVCRSNNHDCYCSWTEKTKVFHKVW